MPTEVPYGAPYQNVTYAPSHREAYLRVRSDALRELLDKTPHPARVLEVGCGPGLSLSHLGRLDRHQLVGIDESPAMLRTAAANIRANGARAELVRGSALELPFVDGTFDFVYATRFIHLFRDKGAVVREFQRVARPGGTVAIEFYGRPFHLLAYLRQRPRPTLNEYLSHFPQLSEVRRLVGPAAQFIPLRLGGERLLRRVIDDERMRRILSKIWPTSGRVAVAEYLAVFTR
jgi:ubiquinone/menaquinone biosynthesis C-methylase UbiE